VAEKLQYDRNKNFGFKRAEVLPGNIGYLELSGFSRLNKYSKATADAALTLLSNSSALIIDVRYGVGGSPEMVNYILSHFFKDTTHIADIYIRSEKATIPYYTQPDSTYGALNQIPIYVLTSYKTFSAAEGLTYALKSLNRAVIVGETTRGGAHTVTYRPLSSGFVADIPFGHAIDPRTKTSWEGVGIIPNISVNADLAPETAEQLIFSKQLANCVDSTQAQSIRWQRDLLTSINHPLHLEANDLYAYTGTYGVYTITFDNEELYYQKLGKAKFPLIPMKQNQFRVKGNDSFMVVFQRDAMRVVCTIITYYDDGRTEIGHRQLK
jgi:C-terminal processing protease CtpA/Prc